MLLDLLCRITVQLTLEKFYLDAFVEQHCDKKVFREQVKILKSRLFAWCTMWNYCTANFEEILPWCLRQTTLRWASLQLFFVRARMYWGGSMWPVIYTYSFLCVRVCACVCVLGCTYWCVCVCACVCVWVGGCCERYFVQEDLLSHEYSPPRPSVSRTNSLV